jgi:hypothetical protein
VLLFLIVTVFGPKSAISGIKESPCSNPAIKIFPKESSAILKQRSSLIPPALVAHLMLPSVLYFATKISVPPLLVRMFFPPKSKVPSNSPVT